MRRTQPFPGFSRGVPILGYRPRPAEPAPGAYFYQVPALINRDGKPLAAESFEVRLDMPLTGVHFKNLAKKTEEEMRTKEADPTLCVVLLQPFFLGFVPQDKLDEADVAGNGNGGQAQ